MLTTQRSGSTWVMEVMSRQEGVSAIEEIFLNREDTPMTTIGSKRERWVHYRNRVFPGKHKAYKRPGQLRDYLRNEVFQEEESAHAVGFKLMYNQLYMTPELWLNAIFQRMRVIHLVRRNTFDLVLSKYFHDSLKTSHAFKDIDLPTIDLDPEHVISEIRLAHKRRTYISRILSLSPLSSMEVCYEDICETPESFESILGFVGAQFTDRSPSCFRKINRKSYPDVIRNFDEVEQALMANGFGQFIDSHTEG